MMTDLQKLEELFTKAHILFKTEEYKHTVSFEDDTVLIGKSLTVEEGKGPRNIGYNSFFTEFYFDEYENLVGIGAFE